jgi:anthranilate synthase/aminodeoxychorismate synthase-like glutamine amidotransferase
MNALLIDAYDSFVFIIDQYLRSAGFVTRVVRNDKITLDEIAKASPDFIVLGPGPGHPADARFVEIIARFGGTIPLLGVCLGHQAIGLAFGGVVARARQLMHGKTSLVDHDGKGCFVGCAVPLRATRYHSLVVDEGSVPSCLEVTATARDDGHIMGLRHRELPIESVQFHPESICTESGLSLFRNFVDVHVRDKASPVPADDAATG